MSTPRLARSFASRCAGLLADVAKARLEFDHALGCGADGCVWPVQKTDRWVLKVTKDKDEGRIARSIVAIRARSPCRLRGIVEIRDVWVARVGTKDAVGIVRESARPFASAETKAGYHASVPGKVGRSEPRAAALIEGLTGDYLEEAEGGHDSSAIRAAQEMQKVPFMAALGESLVTLARRGVFLEDLHLGNVGWSLTSRLCRPAGSLIVMDFGRAYIPSGALPTGNLRRLRCR